MSAAVTPNFHEPDQLSFGGDDDGGQRVAVVVGLDGSPTSWNAFAWACGEAKRLEGRVLAVYVSRAIAATASAGATTVVHYEEAKRGYALQLREAASVRAKEYGASVGFIHLQGDTANTLTAVAVARHADIIAIGKSTKLIHRVAGSLGRRLMHRCSQPIVAIIP